MPGLYEPIGLLPIDEMVRPIGPAPDLHNRRCIMSKPTKSNPEKGLRTVTIEFAGKTRQLKYTHPVIGDFENVANSILRSAQVISEGKMLFADGIMDGWLGNARILSYALLYGLKHEDKELSLGTIDGAIDSFIEAGGNKQDLIRAIITAYRYATNPSSLVSMMRNWKISDDRLEILTQAENEKITTIERAIVDVRAKMIPGSPSTESPKSNLD